jgi:hypothetical protein
MGEGQKTILELPPHIIEEINELNQLIKKMRETRIPDVAAMNNSALHYITLIPTIYHRNS